MLRLFNHRIKEILLVLWLVTYFFGSKIGSLSLGFLTLYPNLIITIVILIGNIKIVKRSEKGLIFHFFFLFLFVLYSVIWIIFSGSDYFSKFELKSHIINLFVFLLLLINQNVFEFEKLKSILSNTLWTIFVGFVLFGFFEIVFGFHFTGEYTRKLMLISYNISDYSPIFIFDNPNDYILNCVAMFFILLIVDSKLFTQKWKVLFFTIILLLLTIYCQARIAEFILISLLMIVVYFHWKSCILSFIKDNKLILSSLLISFLLLFSFNDYMFIQKEKKTEVLLYNAYFFNKKEDNYKMEDLSKLDKEEKKNILNQIVSRNQNYGYNSKDIRLKLFKNGIFLIKSNPILGVGPGQFQTVNSEKAVPFDIGTNYSPHNYIIEMISNYGILGVLYFIYFGFLFMFTFKMKTQKAFILRLVLVLFYMASFLPSAFIYQPMNMLFSGIWILSFYSEKKIINERK